MKIAAAQRLQQELRSRSSPSNECLISLLSECRAWLNGSIFYQPVCSVIKEEVRVACTCPVALTSLAHTYGCLVPSHKGPFHMSFQKDSAEYKLVTRPNQTLSRRDKLEVAVDEIARNEGSLEHPLPSGSLESQCSCGVRSLACFWGMPGAGKAPPNSLNQVGDDAGPALKASSRHKRFRCGAYKSGAGPGGDISRALC